MNHRSLPSRYTFGEFVLDARRRLLMSRNGQVLQLTTKSFDTLMHLVEHAGEVVTKASLMASVWPNVRVEENSLSQCVATLRRVLGDRVRILRGHGALDDPKQPVRTLRAPRASLIHHDHRGLRGLRGRNRYQSRARGACV